MVGLFVIEKIQDIMSGNCFIMSAVGILNVEMCLNNEKIVLEWWIESNLRDFLKELCQKNESTKCLNLIKYFTR